MTKNHQELLIIDDQEEQLTCLRLLVQASYYKAITKSNGAEALQYLSDNPNTISLILSDVNMPVMDGLEFLSKIKSDPNVRNIPVILQSAATDDEVRRGLALGADWFLRKPYKGAELYVAIDKLRPKMIAYERSPIQQA